MWFSESPCLFFLNFSFAGVSFAAPMFCGSFFCCSDVLYYQLFFSEEEIDIFESVDKQRRADEMVCANPRNDVL